MWPESSGIIKLTFLDEECQLLALIMISCDGLLSCSDEIEIRYGLGGTAYTKTCYGTVGLHNSTLADYFYSNSSPAVPSIH